MKYLSDKQMLTEQLEDFSVMSVGCSGAHIWRDQEGLFHREDGPAIIRPNGEQVWFQHGKLHRVGGPAYKHITSEGWMQNGAYHREDGPAYINRGLKLKIWYLNGVLVSEAAVRALGKMG